MDAAARELKLDPAELRRRNLIRPEQMPYKNPMEQTYDCGEFEKLLDQGLLLADWNGYAARRAASEERGLLRGRAVSTFLEWTGGNALTEQVVVNVLPEGIIELSSATQAMGQGIATSYAQLAVDVFGVPIESIRVLQGDTDRANGFGSAGSRSLFTGGAAVSVASQRTVDHAKELAAQALEASAGDIELPRRSLSCGRHRCRHRAVRARRAPTRCTHPRGRLEHGRRSELAERMPCVRGRGRSRRPAPSRSSRTPRSTTSAASSARRSCAARSKAARCRASARRCASAWSTTPTAARRSPRAFMDYAMPRADMFRAFKTQFDTSVPCLTNALGVKGVGELGTIGATPTVVNAVVDALANAGLGRDAERVQMPLTAQTVWRALQRDFDPSPFG